MSKPDIDASLRSGELILLDTSALIAYFDKNEQVSQVAEHIIDELVRSGRNPAVVSMVTVMEVLVQPLRQEANEACQLIMDFLSNFPNIQPIPIDLDIAQKAASLRARHGFRSPDALIIATGILARVSHLVTNDGNWQKKLRPISNRANVCYLGDYLQYS